MKHPDKEQLRRLLRFCCVGVLTAGIYLVCASLLVARGIDLQVASATAFVFAVIIQFVLHRSFTFGSTNAVWHDAPRFFAVVTIGCLSSAAIVSLGQQFGAPQIFSMLAIVFVTPVINWVGFSLWVFVRRTAS